MYCFSTGFSYSNIRVLIFISFIRILQSTAFVAQAFGCGLVADALSGADNKKNFFGFLWNVNPILNLSMIVTTSNIPERIANFVSIFTRHIH